jgi:hypothetical protein
MIRHIVILNNLRAQVDLAKELYILDIRLEVARTWYEMGVGTLRS